MEISEVRQMRAETAEKNLRAALEGMLTDIEELARHRRRDLVSLDAGELAKLDMPVTLDDLASWTCSKLAQIHNQATAVQNCRVQLAELAEYLEESS